jgi:hypothetical protein
MVFVGLLGEQLLASMTKSIPKMTAKNGLLASLDIFMATSGARDLRNFISHLMVNDIILAPNVESEQLPRIEVRQARV